MCMKLDCNIIAERVESRVSPFLHFHTYPPTYLVPTYHHSNVSAYLDLVIWGNEHECQPNLAESLVGTYRILQPGSSIACSLNVSESSQFPKHMAFVEVREKKFRMKPIRFSQVRQFVYGELRLQDFEFLQPNNPKIDDQIKGVLTTKINEMILEGRNEVQEALTSDFRYSTSSYIYTYSSYNCMHTYIHTCRYTYSSYHCIHTL